MNDGSVRFVILGSICDLEPQDVAASDWEKPCSLPVASERLPDDGVLDETVGFHRSSRRRKADQVGPKHTSDRVNKCVAPASSSMGFGQSREGASYR